jgi:type VI secretion system secreted protein Hcp
VSEIVVTKLQDSASTDLFRQSMWGEGATVQIDFVRALPDGKPEVYMSITLENTLVSSFSVSGSGGAGDKPMESLALNFTKVTYDVKTANRMIPGEKPTR